MDRRASRSVSVLSASVSIVCRGWSCRGLLLPARCGCRPRDPPDTIVTRRSPVSHRYDRLIDSCAWYDLETTPQRQAHCRPAPGTRRPAVDTRGVGTSRTGSGHVDRVGERGAGMPAYGALLLSTHGGARGGAAGAPSRFAGLEQVLGRTSLRGDPGRARVGQGARTAGSSVGVVDEVMPAMRCTHSRDLERLTDRDCRRDRGLYWPNAADRWHAWDELAKPRQPHTGNEAPRHVSGASK
jgi:hypothetical protein